MIQKDTVFKITESVALVLKDSKEVELFSYGLVANELKNITSFQSAKEAYEVAIRQQFTIFVTRVEMKDMSGLVFIQKIRETGNYGLETHLIVCDEINPSSLSIFFEYDLPYVIVAPFKKDIIVEKIKYLMERENSLPEEEMSFREARAAFSSNIFALAEAKIQQILDKNPNLEKALILKGDLAMKEGKLDVAEELYEKALKINPKSFVAATKLAMCYLAKGDFQKSSPIFNSLFDMNKYNIKVLETAGLSNIKSHDYVNAQKHIGQLTQIDEQNKAGSTLQVDLYIQQGNYEGLPKTLLKTHTEEEMVKFLNSAGVKLSKEKDPASAIKMYSACLNEMKSDKYRYAIYYNMGLAYKMQKDFQKAKDYFEKSLELNSGFEKAKLALKDLN